MFRSGGRWCEVHVIVCHGAVPLLRYTKLHSVAIDSRLTSRLDVAMVWN